MALINAKSRFKNAATKAGLGLAAIATAMTPITAANAMVRGDTATPEVMARHLKAEGQEVVALANRENIYNNELTLFATAFTCSSDGSHGYIIEYNSPLGGVPTQSEVVARTQHCSTHNIYSSVEPVASINVDYDETSIGAKCEEILEQQQAGMCGSYEQAIRNARNGGERIAYEGFNSNALNRNTFQIQGHFTVTAEANDEGFGALWYTTDEGSTVLYSTYSDFRYTPLQQKKFSDIPQISMR